MTLSDDTEVLPSTGVRLPPPPRRWSRFDQYRIVEEGLSLAEQFIVGSGTMTRYPLPGVVQRVLRTDSSSPESILDLVASLGHLGVRRRDLSGDLGQFELAPLLFPDEPLMTEKSESLADTASAIDAIKALTLLQRRAEKSEYVRDRARLNSDWPRAAPWACPPTDEDAMDLMSTELARGFLNVRLVVRPSKDHRGLESVAIFGYSLYSICIAELADHMHEGLLYRTCANEGCRQTMDRQDGGASKGRPHRDSRYCSVSCRTAQAQREHRRRKSAER